jgi:hypothetical protein
MVCEAPFARHLPGTIRRTIDNAHDLEGLASAHDRQVPVKCDPAKPNRRYPYWSSETHAVSPRICFAATLSENDAPQARRCHGDRRATYKYGIHEIPSRPGGQTMRIFIQGH